MNQQLACFISSSYNIDISTIKNILYKNDITIYDTFSSNLELGNSIEKNIKQKIRQVDFAIFVITDNNPNVFYEIGICDGIGKEYLIITDRNVNIPFNLQNTLYLQNKLTDENSLLFPLTQFVKKISNKKKTRTKRSTSKLVERGKSNTFYDTKIINTLNDLKTKIQYLRENGSEQELSLIIEKLFNVLDFNFVDNKRGPDNGVDFAFWNNKLGTPIIVELKYGKFSHANIKKFEEQINTYAVKSDAKIALLLYLDKSDNRFEITSSFNPLILAYDIEDFIHELLKNSFEDLILTKRNKHMHGSL